MGKWKINGTAGARLRFTNEKTGVSYAFSKDDLLAEIRELDSGRPPIAAHSRNPQNNLFYGDIIELAIDCMFAPTLPVGPFVHYRNALSVNLGIAGTVVIFNPHDGYDNDSSLPHFPKGLAGAPTVKQVSFLREYRDIINRELFDMGQPAIFADKNHVYEVNVGGADCMTIKRYGDKPERIIKSLNL